MNSQDPQKIARVFGWLFVATFVTSIPAYFFFYAPLRDDPALITGTGADPTASVALGAALEVFLIIANVGTAVVIYPILKRQSEIGAIGYVSARLVEGMFIAIGIISVLTLLAHAAAGHGGRPLSARRSSRSMTGRSWSGRASSRGSRTDWSWAT